MSNFYEKIKRLGEVLSGDRFFMPVLIVLVGSAAFALGRLSESGTGRNMPVQIITEASTSPQTASMLSGTPSAVGDTVPQGDGRVVGSKNGSKYHLPWCSGAQRIAEANKVWFASVEAAKAAGYTPAANCKGLE